MGSGWRRGQCGRLASCTTLASASGNGQPMMASARRITSAAGSSWDPMEEGMGSHASESHALGWHALRLHA